MPDRLIGHAIQAADLAQGLGLTPLVAPAVGTAAVPSWTISAFSRAGTRISNSPVSSATPAAQRSASVRSAGPVEQGRYRHFTAG
ncbi:MAG: hypothetical protein WAL72_15270 [Streptosporangiaceae bacterium]